MKQMKKYHGVVVPMVTPVTKDGHVDLDAVKRIVDHFARNNVAALFTPLPNSPTASFLPDNK